MIFMHGDLGWDQLQVMMSKSTTVDLLKMHFKLEEFFTQQFKSSKRVFSSLGNEGSGPGSSFRRRPTRKKTSTTESMGTLNAVLPAQKYKSETRKRGNFYCKGSFLWHIKCHIYLPLLQ